MKIIKKNCLFLSIALIISFSSACVSGSLKFHQLSPIKTEAVTTAQEFYAQAEPSIKKQAPPNAQDIVILGDDKIFMSLSLYELKDIFWLEIYIYNDGDDSFVINPSDLILLDENRSGIRRLEPHDAANIYLARVSLIPPYQPKYEYEVQSTTTGYLYSSGYYTAQTQSTITQKEDPYYALGYSIGAVIEASNNKKLTDIASRIYWGGYVEDSTIPSKTGGYGNIYWIKPTNWIPPIILRFASSGYEVNFLSKKIR